MTEKPKQEFPTVADPDGVPVTFVDHIAATGQFAGVVSISFAVARGLPKTDGTVDADLVMVARHRLNMVTAMQLRDLLGNLIAQAETNMKQALGTAILSTAAPGKSGKPS